MGRKKLIPDKFAEQATGIRLSSHEKLCSERMAQLIKSIDELKKDVKEIQDSVKLFEKTAKEVSTLQHRLEAMYENIGGKLSRYYEIGDVDSTAPLAPKNADITEKQVFYTDKKNRKRKFDDGK